MGVFYPATLAILLFISYWLWNQWQQAQFEKTELEKAIYKADKAIGFVEQVKPQDISTEAYYALSWNERIATDEREKAYRSLWSARLSGESIQRNEDHKRSEEDKKRFKKKQQ